VTLGWASVLPLVGYGSRDGVGSSTAGSSFGHNPQRLHRLLVGDAGQRCEAGRGEDRFVDRRVRVLFEESKQPSGGDPRVTGSGSVRLVT